MKSWAIRDNPSHRNHHLYFEIPSGNQRWLAGKWTIEIGDVPIALLKPPSRVDFPLRRLIPGGYLRLECQTVEKKKDPTS